MREIAKHEGESQAREHERELSTTERAKREKEG